MSEIKNSEEIIKNKKYSFKKRYIVLITISVLILLFIIYQFILSSPVHEQTYFEVEKGMSVREIATKAKNENLIRSELLLYIVLTTEFDPKNIHAGTYIIDKDENLNSIAKKLASKEVVSDTVKLTIPEGLRLTEITKLANSTLTNFDSKFYEDEAKLLEGYLFPETYFVPKNFTAEQLIDLQQKTFNEKIEPLQPQIQTSELSEYEIITLASIIEREANSEESMKIVSGILQNRLAIDMPLQADATMEYVLNKPLSELTASDLDIDSLYNSYLYRGLPPTPIGNPGLKAIEAVLEPTETDFFYYITGNNGNFYYAETLKQHNQNIAEYLR